MQRTQHTGNIFFCARTNIAQIWIVFNNGHVATKSKVNHLM